MSVTGNAEQSNVLKGRITGVPKIDKTLTKAGECADAKVVGDALKQNNRVFENLRDKVRVEEARLDTLLSESFGDSLVMKEQNFADNNVGIRLVSNGTHVSALISVNLSANQSVTKEHYLSSDLDLFMPLCDIEKTYEDDAGRFKVDFQCITLGNQIYYSAKVQNKDNTALEVNIPFEYPLEKQTNAEVNDARIDYKGNTHENLGKHIRAVSEELAEKVGHKVNVAGNEDKVVIEVVDEEATMSYEIDMNTKATAIIQTVQGELIEVTDASNNHLRGLRVFGKSTQDETPTPDAPVEIVGADVVVSVAGKNLFDANSCKLYNNVGEAPHLGNARVGNNYVVLTKTGEYAYFFGHYLDVTPGKTYTISFDGGVNEEGDAHAVFVYEDKPYGKLITNLASKVKASKSFVATSEKIFVGLYACGTTTTSEELVYTDVQLELGESATEYEPRKEQTLAIPYTLHGIDDVRDEVDFERGKLIRRYEKLSLAVADMNNSEDYPGWKGFTDLTKYLPSGYNRIVETLINVGENVNINVNAGVIYMGTSYYGMTQSEWKAKHLNLVVDVLMPLIEPVEIDLTAEEIEAYKELRSNYPNTTVTNSAGAVMEVSYNADTKIFFTQNTSEDGITPHIGDNGNWFIGTTDTGVKAQGEDGKDGQDGRNGQDGKDGKDATSPTISVSAIEGGYRITITDVNGTKSVDVKDGKDGEDGLDGNASVTAESIVEALGYTPINTEDIINDLQTDEGNKPLSASQGVYLKHWIQQVDTYTDNLVHKEKIADNLTTQNADFVLSAKQGKVLKGLIDAIAVPTKTSQLTNDSGFLTQHQSLSDYAKKSEIPTTASQVGADASGTAESKVSSHNTSDTSHNDIRLLIEGLTSRLNTLANSDDTSLDQMKEVVAYIKNNKSLIDGITTSKVNVADIIDNLTTSVSNKPLSAKQGVELKALIDKITVPTKTSQLTNDSGFLTDTNVLVVKSDDSIATHTGAEILQAYSDGKAVLLDVDGSLVPLYSVDEEKAIFVRLIDTKTANNSFTFYFYKYKILNGDNRCNNNPVQYPLRYVTKTSELTNDSGYGKVKTVNGVEPDENGNVEVEATGGTGGVTSWNDLEDKPFYSYEEEGEIVFSEVVGIPTSGSKAMETEQFDLVIGDTYKVTIEGEEYECVARSITMSDENGTMTVTHLGNGEIDGAVVSSEGNGEPFLIEFGYIGVSFFGFIRVPNSKNNDVTLEVVHVKKESVPLPVEYLPDGVPYMTTGTAVLLQEMSTAGLENDEGMFIIPTFEITAGETYTVELNGVAYSCTGIDASTVMGDNFEPGTVVVLGNPSVWGSGDNGLPFLIMSMEGMCGFTELNGNLDNTLSVYGGKVEKRRLPEELLPVGFGSYFTEMTWEGEYTVIDGHKLVTNMGVVNGESIEYFSDEDFKTLIDIMKRKIILMKMDVMETYYMLDCGYDENGEINWISISSSNGRNGATYCSQSYYTENGGL